MNVPAKILLVTFAEQDSVMVEHIADYSDSRIGRPDVVVLIDDDVIVPCQDHDGKNLHNAEHGLVSVPDNDVVNESGIMRQTVLDVPTEFLSKKGRSLHRSA